MQPRQAEAQAKGKRTLEWLVEELGGKYQFQTQDNEGMYLVALSLLY